MSLRRTHAIVCLAGALAAVPASATRLMDMEAEQLVRAAGFARESLALTPNQEILFQQVSARSMTVLRARQVRREHLQADLKARLTDPRQQLRDMALALDQEAATSTAEERQLRELWLTLHDALTDAQRTATAQFLVSQLERVDAPARPSQERAQGERGEHGPRQGGKGRPGGAPGGAF